MKYLGGKHSVLKMLETYPKCVTALHLSEGQQDNVSLISLAKKHGIRVIRTEKEQLNQWLPQVNHQGVVLAFERLPSVDLQTLIDQANAADKIPLLLVLDKIQDPQNLGACLRSAAAFGVDGIIIPKDKAVGVTPAVIKVSVGAAAIVPVVTVTNLARAIRMLKEAGYWIYGTSERAEQPIEAADVSVPTAWVMGNEMKGVSANIEKQCDALFVIPTADFSTLNIATSASICLYQTFCKRRRVGA